MDPTSETHTSTGSEETPAFDPAMLAATKDDQPAEEHQPSAADTPAQDKTAEPRASGQRSTRSAEDIEKMRAARERARNDALRRTAGRPGAAGSGPSTPWGQRASSSNPYVDPRVAQAEAAPGPPPWLGTRWRDIPPKMQREAWIGLRRWVDWLINEFRLQEEIVPRCWFMHPNLVQELYAAMCMEQKAWEEAAASLTPMMMWHPNLHAMNMRLRDMVADLGSCSKGTHQPVEHLERDYDEDQWRRVAYGRRETTSVPRPGAGEEGYLVRARVIGPAEVELAVSDTVVGISPIKGAEPATVELRRDPTTAAKDSLVHLDAEAVAEAEEVIWEKAETWTHDEATGAITSAAWKRVNGADEEQHETTEAGVGTPNGSAAETTEPPGSTL